MGHPSLAAGPSMADPPQRGSDRSPPSKRSNLVDNLCIAAYCWSFLVFGLQVALLGPTSSEVAQSLGVLEADLGIVYTVNGFISIIGAVPSGWAIDKLPGHMVLAVSLALEVRRGVSWQMPYVGSSSGCTHDGEPLLHIAEQETRESSWNDV